MVCSMSPEYCGVSGQRVSTFDGAEIHYKLKDRWHLVTRDCSNQYGVSILAQSSGNNSMVSQFTVNTVCDYASHVKF